MLGIIFDILQWIWIVFLFVLVIKNGNSVKVLAEAFRLHMSIGHGRDKLGD